MATEKQLKTRLMIKSDTEENWGKAVNFIPKKGEPILYTDINQLKFGDGTTKVGDLPFFDTVQIIDLVVASVNSPIEG